MSIITSTRTMFKETKAESDAARRKRKRAVIDYEDRNKSAVRKDDNWTCRFPRCRCTRQRIAVEVAHVEHKQMGGDPAMIRSEVGNLICLCPARHRESRVSLHAGTVRLEFLTDLGTRGAVRWWVDITAIDRGIASRQSGDERWFPVGEDEVTSEKPRRLHPPTAIQGALLEQIAEMEA